MSAFVYELLHLHPDLRLVAGDSGLNNTIQFVTVMEAPDFPNWVSGHEFVLSTFYSIYNDVETQLSVIRQLAAKGVSGLAVKVNRYVNAIDDRLIDIANQLGFPLFSVNREAKFRELMYAINTLLINRRAHLLEEMNSIAAAFHALTYQKSSLQEVCNYSSRIIEAPMMILNAERERVAQSDRPMDGVQWNELHNMIDRACLEGNINCFEYYHSPYAIVRCTYKGQHIGFLVIKKESWTDRDHLLAQHAANAVAVSLLESYMQAEIEDRMLRSFVQDLLFSDTDSASLSDRAHFFGWKTLDYFGAFVLAYTRPESPSSEELEVLLRRWRTYMNNTCHNHLTVRISENIVTLVSLSKDHPWLTSGSALKRALSQFVQKNLAHTPLDQTCVRVGTGAFYPDLPQIKDSYRQAKSTLAMLKEDNIGIAHDYLVELFVDHSKGNPISPLITTTTMTPLLNHDREHEGNLVRAIELFLFSESLDSAASQLYIHPNTLRNRLNKAKSLTGIDPFSTKGKLLYCIGLLLIREAQSSSSKS